MTTDKFHTNFLKYIFGEGEFRKRMVKNSPQTKAQKEVGITKGSSEEGDRSPGMGAHSLCKGD